MLYPLLRINEQNITFSEIKNNNGKEQIRIYSDEPNPETKDFNELELYIPEYKITKRIGYSDEAVDKIISHVKCCENVIWNVARHLTVN